MIQILADVLSDDELQASVRAMYPIRDIVVHRKLTSMSGFRDLDGSERNIMEIDEELYNSLSSHKIVDENHFIIFGDIYFIEIFEFAKSIHQIFLRTINRILENLNYDILLNELPIESRNEILNDKLITDPNDFFDIEGEPDYL